MIDGLKSVADGVKRLQSLKQEISDLDFKEQLLQLKNDFLTAKEEILKVRGDNAALKDELAKQKKVHEKRHNTIEVQGFKYDSVDNTPTGLPYCPKCEVSEDGKLYRLNRRTKCYSNCPNCSNSFNAAANGLVHQEETQEPLETPDGSWSWR